MLIRHAVDFLYLCPLIKYEVNYTLSSLKVLMELGISLLNHTLAGPFRVRTFLDKPVAVVPPTIILISLRGGLGRSFSLPVTFSCGGSTLSLLTNHCNFPCLIRALICYFKL